MKEELYNKVNSLKSLIENSEEMKELNRIDEVLNNDVNYKILSSRVKEAKDNYEKLSSLFSEDSIRVVEARKDYSALKKELDTHPLTIEYMKAYKKVREIYSYINEKIFNMFQEKRHC